MLKRGVGLSPKTPSGRLTRFPLRREPAIPIITFRRLKTCTLVEMDFDPNTVVRKRLHVAGLTPGVSASDLTQRLGTFGTVIAVDGVGALDGLGRPRPFAYVTLEAKNSQLTRCMWPLIIQFLFELRATGMNLLSGTTWKGAKLRIGEAKPDFRERYGNSYLYGPLQSDCFIL